MVATITPGPRTVAVDVRGRSHADLEAAALAAAEAYVGDSGLDAVVTIGRAAVVERKTEGDNTLLVFGTEAVVTVTAAPTPTADAPQGTPA